MFPIYSALLALSLSASAAPGPIAPGRAIGRLMDAAPVAWRAPVAAFLEASIDATALRALLAAPPVATGASAWSTPAHFLTQADSPMEADRLETARKLTELDLVLGHFLFPDTRGPLIEAAQLARERLSAPAREEILASARRVAREWENERPIPPAVEAAAAGFTGGAPTADELDIELPYLRDVEPSLDDNGLIRIDEDGFPDHDTYFAAAKAAKLRDRLGRGVIAAADRALLERLGTVYDRTDAALFSDENGAARTLRYTEPTPGGATMSILDIVRTNRFRTPGRWVWSSEHLPEAPHGFAAITDETARSPFLRMLGPGSTSAVYWAALPGGEFGRPDPMGMRVRVNSDAQRRPRTLEVLTPAGFEEDGEIRWKAFFFTMIGDEWVPGVRRKIAESKKRCIHCHFRVDAQGERRLTPIPTILHVKQDFLDVGYRDTALVTEYLKMRERYARLASIRTP